MTTPQVIECSASCTVTVVHELALPVLSMSTEDAAQISGAVLLVWVVGFAFRMLIRTLYIDSGSTNSEDNS
ncbi:MAG: hypothetical protein KGM99_14630 [Burkholderiales bacterium]|nr:hypothetical protein [Burkholderiales bacterium]